MPQSASGKSFIKVPEVIELLKVEEGMRVGDFGCGASGYFLIPISQKVGDDGKVYALDIQKTVLKSLEGLCVQKGLNNVEVVWSDIESYGSAKILESSLDKILLINVLFQTKNHKEVFREILRLLKIGGNLVFVDWLAGNTLVGPPENLRVSKEKIMEIAHSLNLEIKKEFEPGPYHYGFLFEKRF